MIIKLYYCEWQIKNQVKKELRMDRETFINLCQVAVDQLQGTVLNQILQWLLKLSVQIQPYDLLT